MLDEVLEERIQMLAKVRDEIINYRAHIANLEKFQQKLESDVQNLQSVKQQERDPAFSGMMMRYRRVIEAEKARSSEHEARPRPIRDTAYQILKQSPQPIWVHYSELMKQVEAQGVQVGGQRPDDNFMNHLSQDERFIRRNGRSTWSLREWFPNHAHDEAQPNGVTVGN